MDGDGYFVPITAPGERADCDDADPAVNPGEWEDGDTPEDDNCNAKTHLVTMWMDTNFGMPWVSSGPPTPHTITTPDAELRVGDETSWTPATSTRSVVLPLPTASMLVVKVTNDAGDPVHPCTISLQTSPGTSAMPTSWNDYVLTGAGLLAIPTGITPGRTLRKVKVACGGLHEVKLDWLQLQDSEAEFGPMSEAVVRWKDMRNPVADAEISMARDNGSGKLWLGTDSSGVALFADGVWQARNGWGAESLVAGGIIGVSDILPMEDATEEVFVLSGDMGGRGPDGGFWRSPDDGETWFQLGSTVEQWPPVAGAATVLTDDVGGYSLESNCPGNKDGRQWQWGGGHRLAGQSVHPVSGETVYIANGDWDNLGVSVWDGTAICPMPTSGDPLPADRIGALLRVDTALGTPVLVVGYRAQANLGPGLYVCQLPPGGFMCVVFGPEADCQVVDVDPSGMDNWDLSGVDVRDLEEDTYFSTYEVGPPLGEVGVLIADGGARPGGADADGDGVVDTECDNLESAIHELLISDTLVGGGGLYVEVLEGIATAADFPQIALGNGGITGLSLDPFSTYVFANVPATPNSRYSYDRMYRVPAADLLGTGSIPLWEAVNSGDEVTPTAYWQEDPYEAMRRTGDLDLEGTWMEAVVTSGAKADVFPARSAPGAGYDTVWFWTALAPGNESIAFIPAGVVSWFATGLTWPWSDDDGDGVDEPEGDVQFTVAPTIDVAGQRTFQGVPTVSVAIGNDGHVWAASGDQAISHVDASLVATNVDRHGAEVDCLWHGMGAAANSIVAVDPADPVGEPGEPIPSVVWATLGSNPGESGNPQGFAVVRTLDQGASWMYGAAGFSTGSTAEGWKNRYAASGEDDVIELDYGDRLCIDRDTTHFMRHFVATDLDPDAISPAHAFSTGATNEEARKITTASVGAPGAVRALNEHSAIVLFRPTATTTLVVHSDDTADTAEVEYVETPVTEGASS